MKPVKQLVLHVGCGPLDISSIPFINNKEEWKEVRLDIDPVTDPDILASITDMWPISANRFDMVYSSHNLEHLYPYQVPVALAEMCRVLVGGTGVAIIMVPDIAAVARKLLADGITATAYTLTGGQNITPIDMLYGWREATACGNEFMAHKCGFTADSLKHEMECAGFVSVKVTESEYDLVAVGLKPLCK